MKRVLHLCVLLIGVLMFVPVAPVNAAATPVALHTSAPVTSATQVIAQTPCVLPSHLLYDSLHSSDTILPGDTLGELMLRNAIPFSALSEVLKANPKIGNPDLVYAGETIHFGNAAIPRYAVLQPGQTAAYATALQAQSGSCTPAKDHNASLYHGIEHTSCTYPHPADYLVFNDPIWFGNCFGFQAGLAGQV